MNYFDNAGQPQIDRRRGLRASTRWRIGDASVTTEELVAWQLGPERYQLHGSRAARQPQHDTRG